jgi:hypothetical protein
MLHDFASIEDPRVSALTGLANRWQYKPAKLELRQKLRSSRPPEQHPLPPNAQSEKCDDQVNFEMAKTAQVSHLKMWAKVLPL